MCAVLIMNRLLLWAIVRLYHDVLLLIYSFIRYNSQTSLIGSRRLVLREFNRSRAFTDWNCEFQRNAGGARLLLPMMKFVNNAG